MLDKTFQDTWNTRLERLKELNMTYSEFLLSELWNNTRIKAYSRKAYKKCRICCNTENIDLHHTSYKWLGTKDELRTVVPVCRKHHKYIHEYAKSNNISVRLATNIVFDLFKHERNNNATT